MKIVVCAKIVKGEVNPFDACALECALSQPSAEITLLTMGAPSVKEELSRLSRLGVSRVILLSDPALAGSDTLVTSYALSLAIKKLSPDLVLCGRQSIDGDTAQVPPELSEMLGYSLVTNVTEMPSITKTGVTAHTRLGDESAPLPAVVSVERIANLRFPRMRSQAKEIEIWDCAYIGADPGRCGLAASPTKVLASFESRAGTRRCRFITFDQLDGVIRDALLKEEETVPTEESGEKLPAVAVIGRDLYEKAAEIAHTVRVIEETDPQKIADLVKDENAVLWKADTWGRRVAPIVAAKLQTGLCADCIRLTPDGEKLYMTRPAFGGTLTARIECRTKPQMATVRMSDGVRQKILFGLGKGCVGDREKYLALAAKYEAEIGASRTFVDAGFAPYEAQIGLTGKIVRPKVYVACGISGAVQHTCAIEGAGTVIAINPDKNARIFEYADYGIVGKL